MSDKEFKSHFRLERGTAEALLQKISSKLMIKQANSEPEICPSKQLLIALWVWSTPDSYRSVSQRFNVSKSSVARILRRMADVLVEMASSFIKWPEGQHAQNVREHFNKMSEFPGVIGCIDGTHIPIPAPTEHSDSYLNRKGYHSVQMQAVCQHNLKFTNCYVGQVGSVHDARVYRLSYLGQDIENNLTNFPPDCHIIGDSAYPLSPYLLTPYRETGNLTRYQQNYNFRHSSTRMTIERAFGHMKGRFHCLQFFPSPDIAFICKSVISCCVLHNICVDNSDLIPVDAENYRDPSLTNTDFDVRIVENQQRDGKSKRDQIAANLRLSFQVTAT